MNSIESNLTTVRQRIETATKKAGRQPGEITLLAVSKTRSVAEINQAITAGQTAFGENYLQDALPKIAALNNAPCEWHFIGRLQGNKTRPIAESFDWVHSLASIKHAQRLNDQRPAQRAPLSVCLQVNIEQSENKGGFLPDQVAAAVEEISDMPHVELKGLMTIPEPAETLEAQRVPFRRLRELRDGIATSTTPLHTLSMGMSDDLEAAILEGATIVRIGTAIFGPRDYNQ